MENQENDLNKIFEQIEEAFARDDTSTLQGLLGELHPEDIAHVINHLPEEDKFRLLSVLDAETAGDVLLKVDDESLEFLLRELSDQQISRLAKAMDADEAADILAELSDDEQQQVLKLVPAEDSREILELLRYEETTAGGLMSTEYMVVFSGMRAIEALAALHHQKPPPELAYDVYVVDGQESLVGVLSLYDLVFADPDDTLDRIMNPEPVRVELYDDQEDVARTVAKYDLLTVPVVDEKGRLKGVISIDDVLDVIEDEATEDIMRMAGTTEAESVFSPPRRSALRRLPWLYLNLFTALVAASVVGLFQETIRTVVTLAIFMPVVAGMSGNAGTQTLTLVVRAIALGEVTFADSWRIIVRQVTAGFLAGLGVGIFAAVVAILWKGNPIFGLVLGLALVVNLAVACLLGVIIPLTLRKLKLDPALGSGIFLTAATDSMGFFAFLGLATLLLKYLT